MVSPVGGAVLPVGAGPGGVRPRPEVQEARSTPGRHRQRPVQPPTVRLQLEMFSFVAKCFTECSIMEALQFDADNDDWDLHAYYSR